MRSLLRISLPIVVAAVAAAFVAQAATFDLAVDVPARLGSTDFRPDQLLRRTAGSYALLAQLPAGTAIGALHRNPDGSWLLAPDRPTTLGATLYQPRDVVRWDGVAFTSHLDGAAAGIPAASRIDALALDGSGRAAVSFDVPTTIGGTTYLPADLALHDAGSFAVYWSASAAGVPAGANLVGVALPPGGGLILSFDVPVSLGGDVYLPGQLVEWRSGSGFAPYSSDPSWPATAQLRDFALLPPSGTVPDGSSASTALTVNRSGADLVLGWGASCAATDTDYAVYEGTLGSFTTHAPRLCSTGGLTTATLTPGGGDRYYLVVPRNAVSEGSYGRRSDGTERPPAASACLPETLGACAP